MNRKGSEMMPKLKTKNFYYGAVIETIMSYNEDASPSLVEMGEDKQVYKIWTNSSKRECYIYVKYRTSSKDNKKENYYSWQFILTGDDKQRIENYIANDNPVLLVWLCGMKELKGSEIIVIKESEYEKYIKDKSSISISLKANERNFRMHVGGSRENAIQIPRNRIEKNFDYFITEKEVIL